MPSVKELLTPCKTPFAKQRIGRRGDGGYILLRELFAQSHIVYSYGIGGESSFDEECCRLGKRVFMYDPTIEAPPARMDGMYFYPQPFSADILKHVAANLHQYETDMTLKLDVEGDEWNGLLECSSLVFNCFSQMVVEFHGMTGSERQERIFGRLVEHYAVVHLHGNNCTGPGAVCNGFPNIMEITFARRDCLLEACEREDRPYPIPGLDFPNIPNQGDYSLDWWTAACAEG